MVERPSEARVTWVRAEPTPKPPYDRDLVGKWNLFIPKAAIDEVWAEFASAVEAGEFGISAKVSAALPNPEAHDPNAHVVILYAADWRDFDDLRRMLRRIRSAGIAQAVYFKRDRETLASQYSDRGKRTVSVWGSPSGDTIRTKWVGDGKSWVEVTAENQAELIAQIEAHDKLLNTPKIEN